jgi:hypothetical protein
MFVVAAVGLSLGMGLMSQRSREYRDLAEYHRHQEADHAREAELAIMRPGKTIENYLDARGVSGFSGLIPMGRNPTYLINFSEYHKQMKSKYSFAALFPWLPVEPDPPEPF